MPALSRMHKRGGILAVSVGALALMSGAGAQLILPLTAPGASVTPIVLDTSPNGQPKMWTTQPGGTPGGPVAGCVITAVLCGGAGGGAPGAVAPVVNAGGAPGATAVQFFYNSSLGSLAVWGATAGRYGSGAQEGVGSGGGASGLYVYAGGTTAQPVAIAGGGGGASPAGLAGSVACTNAAAGGAAGSAYTGSSSLGGFNGTSYLPQSTGGGGGGFLSPGAGGLQTGARTGSGTDATSASLINQGGGNGGASVKSNFKMLPGGFGVGMGGNATDGYNSTTGAGGGGGGGGGISGGGGGSYGAGNGSCPSGGGGGGSFFNRTMGIPAPVSDAATAAISRCLSSIPNGNTIGNVTLLSCVPRIWYQGVYGDSCDATCGKLALSCNASYFNPVNASGMTNAYPATSAALLDVVLNAGYASCVSTSDQSSNFAPPSTDGMNPATCYYSSAGPAATCATSNITYQRFCPCVVPLPPISSPSPSSLPSASVSATVSASGVSASASSSPSTSRSSSRSVSATVSASPSCSANVSSTPSPSRAASPSPVPPSSVIISVATTFNLPAGNAATAASACDYNTGLSYITTVVITGVLAGAAAEPVSFSCTSSSSRLLADADASGSGGARRLATAATYTVGIVVPTGVSATTVNNAVLALNTASFVASGTIGILANATGQTAASITTATSTSSTCGGGASSGCSLPATGASTGLSAGAIAGIVIGSVAFLALIAVAVFFALAKPSAAAAPDTKPATSVQLGSAGASAARFDTYRSPALAGGALPAAQPPARV